MAGRTHGPGGAPPCARVRTLLHHQQRRPRAWGQVQALGRHTSVDPRSKAAEPAEQSQSCGRASSALPRCPPAIPALRLARHAPVTCSVKCVFLHQVRAASRSPRPTQGAPPTSCYHAAPPPRPHASSWPSARQSRSLCRAMRRRFSWLLRDLPLRGLPAGSSPQHAGAETGRTGSPVGGALLALNAVASGGDSCVPLWTRRDLVISLSFSLLPAFALAADPQAGHVRWSGCSSRLSAATHDRSCPCLISTASNGQSPSSSTSIASSATRTATSFTSRIPTRPRTLVFRSVCG